MGTLLGAALTLGVQFLMHWFGRTTRRRDLLVSIYRELAGNFQSLVAIMHTIKINGPGAADTFLHHVHVSRKKFEAARSETAYDLMKNTSGIERAYTSLGRLKGMGNSPEQLESAEHILFQFEQDLFTGNLNLKLFTRFLDERLASRLKQRKSTEEFWRVRLSASMGDVGFNLN